MRTSGDRHVRRCMYGNRGDRGSVDRDGGRCITEYWWRLNVNTKTLNMRCQHDKEKDTDLMRRGRNLFYRIISHLTPLLRRTTSPPHPIDTLRCPLKASFAGDTAATLHLPMLTALARLRDTTTGDEARRRHNPSYRNVRVSLWLVMMVRRRSRHAGKHRDRSGGRHGGGGRVDLGME